MNPPLRRTDLELAQAVVSGDVGAWHEFVDKYSRLVFSVILRYLARESEDNRRTVFVKVLDTVRQEKLQVYDGRCALSTWLTLITRRLCLDHVRRTFGRRRPPAWLSELSEEDREIYRLHFIEGLDYSQICSRMAMEDAVFPIDRLCQAMARIESHLSRTLGRRLAYDLQARSIGATSGRFLEYLDHLRDQVAGTQAAQQPDRELVRRDTAEQIARLGSALKQLSPFDRQIVERYYYEGWTAKQISEANGLESQRRAYTLISRALRRLRRLLEPRPRALSKRLDRPD